MRIMIGLCFVPKAAGSRHVLLLRARTPHRVSHRNVMDVRATYLGREGPSLGTAIAGVRWSEPRRAQGSHARYQLARLASRAGRIRQPLWVGRCADDITVDAGAIARTVERAAYGELHEFPGDHFAPFSTEGDSVTAQVRDSQLEFLGRVLSPRP